jgi:hypothetical protein
MTEYRGQMAEDRIQMAKDRILKSEVGIRPPASPSCRLYEPEARGAIGAYPPAWKPMAYKPTGWKRPRREGGKIGSQMSGFIFTQSTYSTLSTNQPYIHATHNS